MQQLLEITTVPLKMEVTTTRARFERMDPLEAAMEALNSPRDGGHTNKPAINHHNHANGGPVNAGQSSKVVNPGLSVQGTNPNFHKVGSSTTASVDSNSPDVYVSAGVESSFGGMLYQASVQNATPVLSGIPEAGYVEAGLQNAEMTNIQTQSSVDIDDQVVFRKDMMDAYSTDRGNYDTSLSLGLRHMKFVPGSVNFKVTQWNEVEIDYIGGPVYVPRSADPNYEEETVA